MISCGGRPSMVQPIFCAVPKISLHVPLNSRAIERARNVRAIAKMSSKVMLPLCLTRKIGDKTRERLVMCTIRNRMDVSPNNLTEMFAYHF